MGYLVNRDGDIQTGRIQLELSDEMIRRAGATGVTRIDGLLQVICEEFGLEVEGIEVVRRDGNSLTLQSSWERPSRR